MGDSLIVGGLFLGAGNLSVNNVAIFNITENEWEPLGNDTELANNIVNSLVVSWDGYMKFHLNFAEFSALYLLLDLESYQ